VVLLIYIKKEELKKANVDIAVIPETKKELKGSQELDVSYCTVVSQRIREQLQE
jgi:hypothetical protein